MLEIPTPDSWWLESIHLPTRTFETRMPMTAEQQLERSVLEGKERDELHAIAQALSVKTNTRTKKADMIDGILRATGVSVDDDSPPSTNGDTPGTAPAAGRRKAASNRSAGTPEGSAGTDGSVEHSSGRSPA